MDGDDEHGFSSEEGEAEGWGMAPGGARDSSSEEEDEDDGMEMEGSMWEEFDDEEVTGLSTERAQYSREEDSDSDEEWDESSMVVEDEGPGLKFASALQSVLNADVKHPNRPVMSRNKLRVKKAEQEDFETKVDAAVKREHARMVRKNYVPGPEYGTAEDEKRLLKIATKGVVHLFNSVRQHQKEQPAIEEVKKSDKTLRKKGDEINKSRFMDILGGEVLPESALGRTSGTDGRMAGPAQKQKDSEPGWKVLREDYVLGSGKLKSWDREVEEEDEEELEWDDE